MSNASFTPFFVYYLKLGSMQSYDAVYTYFENIKGAAYKDGDVDRTCKQGIKSERAVKVPAS